MCLAHATHTSLLNKSQFNTIFALLVITNELILEMNSKTRPKCFNLFPSIWKTEHKVKSYHGQERGEELYLYARERGLEKNEKRNKHLILIIS